MTPADRWKAVRAHRSGSPCRTVVLRGSLASRDHPRAVLAGASLPPLPCQGSYFLMPGVTDLGFTSDVECRRHFVIEVGVLTGSIDRPTLGALLLRQAA